MLGTTPKLIWVIAVLFHPQPCASAGSLSFHKLTRIGFKSSAAPSNPIWDLHLFPMTAGQLSLGVWEFWCPALPQSTDEMFSPTAGLLLRHSVQKEQEGLDALKMVLLSHKPLSSGCWS